MFLASLDRQIVAAQSGYSTGNISDFWYSGAPMESDSGVVITPETAMRISTVWKCIRWRGETFAKLPKKLFRHAFVEGRAGRVEAREHHLFRIIHKRPNPLMPSFAFFELMSRDLDTEGNFYAYIQRDDLGRPKHLWRFLPDVDRMQIKVTRTIDPQSGSTVAKYWYAFLDNNGEPHTFYPDEILHIRGLGYDGLRGYSPVRMMMNTLGWNRATQRNSAQFFKNASRPSVILSSATVIKQPQKDELIAALTNAGKRAGSVALIEGGIKADKWSLTPDEAQFIETMEYQQEDIAGIFSVKPHKIGILRNMTNNNIEQQNIEASTDGMQPLSVRVTSWIDLQLLTETESGEYYTEVELKGMVAGDMKSRSDFYKTMINIGVMSPNQVAAEENIEPSEFGDIHVMQLNMAPLDKIATMEATSARAKMGTPEDGGADNEKKSLLMSRFHSAYLHVVRDAVGRITNKKKVADRERSVAQTFYYVVEGIAEGLDVRIGTDFRTEYLKALVQRVADWKVEDTDRIAAEELDRVIDALIKKGVSNA